MIKVLIAGDYCPQERISSMIVKKETDGIFTGVTPIISEADYSLINFECPISESGYLPILKQGPCLHTSEGALSLIKQAGFSCATLANNHFRDFGNKGCMRTIETLKAMGLDYVGGGRNIAEAQTNLIKEIKGCKIAFINVCEHEFSIATDEDAGSNPLDIIWITQSIVELKQNCDCIIVIVHGGHEYYQLPSPRMKKLYRYLVDIGADVIINHHQHCFSGYEVYHDKPIFYGLGNFCFDGNRCDGKAMWHEGYMVTIIIDELSKSNNIRFNIVPYLQCKEKPEVRLMNNIESDRFYERLKEINSIIQDDKILSQSFKRWCISKYHDMELALTPYSRRFFIGLWRRRILPSFLPIKRIVNLFNKIACESHRDVLLSYLNHRL